MMTNYWTPYCSPATTTRRAPLTTTDVSPQYSVVLLTSQHRRGVNGELSHQIWENIEACSNKSVPIAQPASIAFLAFTIGAFL